MKGAVRSRPKGVVVCAGHYFARAELRARNIPLSDRERTGAFGEFSISVAFSVATQQERVGVPEHSGVFASESCKPLPGASEYRHA